MNLVPEHRALLGVDVVGSASNPGYHLAVIPEAVHALLSGALSNCGIDRADILEWESTGDGALLTFASSHLGALLDTACLLDVAASARNRRHKPEVRLRIAVEVGPVGNASGFYEPKITLTRMLESEKFKELFDRCRQEEPDDTVNTALIVSEHAFQTVFSGDHTRLVRRNEFERLEVHVKEHQRIAWVRVPGFDARSLATFIESRSTEEAELPTQAPPASNVIQGSSYGGIQAGTINGGVSQGWQPR